VNTLSARLLGLLTVTCLSSAALAHGPGPIPPVRWALPYGADLVATALDGERLDLFVTLQDVEVDEPLLEAVVRSALEDAFEAGLTVHGVTPWVAVDGVWVPMPALLPEAPPIPRKSNELREAMRSSVVTSAGARRTGALAGKVVYVSAGHGFTWDPGLERWTTQRGNTHDIVEDLVSAETINQLLTTYLENAGAMVFTMRERDMNPEMVIVDAGAGGQGSASGTGSYREEGAFTDSTSGGFRLGLAPYKDGENPFEGGSSRVAATSTTATATATFSFSVEETGDFRVYAAWVAGGNRASDARYAVRHAGGVSRFEVDQRRHGGTWMSLGRFHFKAGETYAVEVANASSVPGTFVSVDAIRVGGGMGDAARGNGSGPATSPLSGRPRWEENARYHIQFSGAPTSVYDYTGDERNDDVGSRSRYAAWQNEEGEDAVYVSWHTNAPAPGVGTSTFVYGPNPPDGTFDFTGAPGSDALGRLLHDEVVNDMRAAIDPEWRNRGFYTAYFGELRKSNNPEMPSVLCEVAFHSTDTDADRLKQPKVRAVAARAFYQSIAKYFATRDGEDVVLLPEPPQKVKLSVDGPIGTLVWEPPAVDTKDLGGDAATGYRVYRSPDGRAFDDGVEVRTTTYSVDGLEPGVPVYFRVTAFNDGGESMPSPVLVASPACSGRPEALLVHGFYRLDATSAPREDLSVFGLGTVVRVRLDEMNRFDALIGHAEAFARAGIAFESSEATAITSIDPAYRLVDWVLGEESTADETFSSAEQAAVTNWLGLGDRTFMTSGAELAWDLGETGTPEDEAFLARLGATYASDDAGTYALLAEDLDLELDDGSLGTYDVAFPDVLAPVPSAEPILSYAGGATAGVRYASAGSVALTFGVPLESLFPIESRASLVASLTSSVDVARVPANGCSEGPADDIADVVERPDIAEVDASAPSSDVDSLTVLRPTREASSSTRDPAGGCALATRDAFFSLLGLFFVLVRRRRLEVP
jgi:N-acetylmuramoyl-L-alanine amidase